MTQSTAFAAPRGPAPPRPSWIARTSQRLRRADYSAALFCLAGFATARALQQPVLVDYSLDLGYRLMAAALLLLVLEGGAVALRFFDLNRPLPLMPWVPWRIALSLGFGFLLYPLMFGWGMVPHWARLADVYLPPILVALVVALLLLAAVTAFPAFRERSLPQALAAALGLVAVDIVALQRIDLSDDKPVLLAWLGASILAAFALFAGALAGRMRAPSRPAVAVLVRFGIAMVFGALPCLYAALDMDPTRKAERAVLAALPLVLIAWADAAHESQQPHTPPLWRRMLPLSMLAASALAVLPSLERPAAESLATLMAGAAFAIALFQWLRPAPVLAMAVPALFWAGAVPAGLWALVAVEGQGGQVAATLPLIVTAAAALGMTAIAWRGAAAPALPLAMPRPWRRLERAFGIDHGPDLPEVLATAIALFPLALLWLWWEDRFGWGWLADGDYSLALSNMATFIVAVSAWTVLRRMAVLRIGGLDGPARLQTRPALIRAAGILAMDLLRLALLCLPGIAAVLCWPEGATWLLEWGRAGLPVYLSVSLFAIGLWAMLLRAGIDGGWIWRAGVIVLCVWMAYWLEDRPHWLLAGLALVAALSSTVQLAERRHALWTALHLVIVLVCCLWIVAALSSSVDLAEVLRWMQQASHLQPALQGCAFLIALTIRIPWRLFTQQRDGAMRRGLALLCLGVTGATLAAAMLPNLAGPALNLGMSVLALRLWLSPGWIVLLCIGLALSVSLAGVAALAPLLLIVSIVLRIWHSQRHMRRRADPPPRPAALGL